MNLIVSELNPTEGLDGAECSKSGLSEIDQSDPENINRNEFCQLEHSNPEKDFNFVSELNPTERLDGAECSKSGLNEIEHSDPEKDFNYVSELNPTERLDGAECSKSGLSEIEHSNPEKDFNFGRIHKIHLTSMGELAKNSSSVSHRPYKKSMERGENEGGGHRSP